MRTILSRSPARVLAVAGEDTPVLGFGISPGEGGTRAGQQLEEDCTEGIDIGGGIDGFAAQLFRAGIGRGERSN